MKVLSEEYGFWYYAILSIVCVLLPLPLFWIGYLCITDAEYWPPILFAVIIICLWFAAYGFFCKARMKFQEDRNK